MPAIVISFECSKVVWGLRLAQRGLCLSDRRRRRAFLRFAEGFAMGCFLDLGLVSFAGCVYKSRCSSGYGWGGQRGCR